MPEPKDKVTVWEAFVGKEFRSESEAQRYEDKHQEKVKDTFRAIYGHQGSYIEELKVCSSIYQYQGRTELDEYGDWPSDKKKEGFEFIRTLYCIHKCFEEESRKGNTKYLGLD